MKITIKVSLSGKTVDCIYNGRLPMHYELDSIRELEDFCRIKNESVRGTSITLSTGQRMNPSADGYSTGDFYATVYNANGEAVTWGVAADDVAKKWITFLNTFKPSENSIFYADCED